MLKLSHEYTFTSTPSRFIYKKKNAFFGLKYKEISTNLTLFNIIIPKYP